MNRKSIAGILVGVTLSLTARSQPESLLIACQGRLFDGKQLLQGEVDLQLRVYNQPTGGEVKYEDRSKVQVVDGIYATYLGDDSVAGSLAGALASGTGYLEVVANGIVFSPREKLSAEAYAIVAARLPNGAITADMMGPAAVHAPHIADGAITPPKLSDEYWSTRGNSGSKDQEARLGTLDQRDLILVVNGQVAGRLSADPESPAVQWGHHANLSSASGATVSGGGTSSEPNLANAPFSSVSGGLGNQANAPRASIGGGRINLASGSASAISGGYSNLVSGNFAVAVGGYGNRVPGYLGSVTGGWQNQVDGAAASIGGGQDNRAEGDASAIGGGYGNHTAGLASTVSGGKQNRATADFATVAGGTNNVASARASFAAGQHAQAEHAGSFVWSGSPAGLQSSADGQFLILAPGHVGIGTNAPDEALTVNGNVKAAAFIGDGSRLQGVLASQVAEGVIGSSHLQAGSITADKLAKGVIPEIPKFEITPGSITADKLAKGVIPEIPKFEITPGSITADKLAKGVIPEIPKFEIKPGSITADKLAKGVIPEIPKFEIKPGSITADKLAKGVIPEIPKFEIAPGSITADKLAKGVIPEIPKFEIKPGSITADKLAKGVIPEIPKFEIAPGSITADKLAKGVIPEIPKFEIAPGSITADKLAKAVIPTVPDYSTKEGGLRFGPAGSAPVELSVAGVSVLRIQPSGEAYNTTLGHPANNVSSTVTGGVVSGGGNAKAPNTVKENYATIGGGLGNNAAAQYATIGGGFANTAKGDGATVAGGWNNTASDLDATVGGGQDNAATGFASTVSGGFNNQAKGNQATIAGGLDNVAQGDLSFVTGRRGKALHTGALIFTDGQDADFASTAEHQFLIRAAGNVGIDTTSPAEKLTVAGNIAPAQSAAHSLGSPALRWQKLYLAEEINFETLRFVNGSVQALTLGKDGSLSAPGLRVLPGAESPRLVGGHAANLVLDTAVGAVVAGGGNAESPNRAEGQYSAVSGGFGNKVSGFSAVVAGGQDNNAKGTASVISGGFNNQADGLFPVIAGGAANLVNANLGVVTGGFSNRVDAAYGVIAGGALNHVAAEYGFAAGRRAKVQHAGSFVWADAVDQDLRTTNRNQFLVRASGGVQFFSNGNQSSGVLLPPGSGSWAMLSDVNSKGNLRAVNEETVLERVAKLPFYTWNYLTQDASVQHIGPTAQDFHQAFGVGESNTHIHAIDADGVALTAIKALYHKLERKDAELEQVKKANADLNARLERLEALLDKR